MNYNNCPLAEKEEDHAGQPMFDIRGCDGLPRVSLRYDMIRYDTIYFLTAIG